MKKIIAMAMMLMLSSCATIIEDYQLDKLESACESSKGIRTIIANGNGSIAICHDGSRIYHKYLLKKK